MNFKIKQKYEKIYFIFSYYANKQFHIWSIVAYKWMRLDAMANLHMAYQSLLIKKNIKDYNTNTIISTEETYWKPAPISELTIEMVI